MATLKITGDHLQPVPFEIPTAAVQPDAQGHCTLMADAAELEGEQLGVETRGGVFQPRLLGPGDGLRHLGRELLRSRQATRSPAILPLRTA